MADPAELKHRTAGSVHVYSTTALEISATKLRADINNNIDPRFLTPDAVKHYIDQDKLYQ